MKNKVHIGLTQRVNMLTQQDWLAENEWQPYLNHLKECSPIPLTWQVIPNDIENIEHFIKEHKIDALILTGGNDIGECSWRDNTERKLFYVATKKRMPIVGICRGAQFIAYLHGASIAACKGHAGTHHPIKLSNTWQKYGQSRNVNSYHNYAITHTDFPNELIITATDENDQIEGFTHKELPFIGMLWHPERENQIHTMDIDLFLNLICHPK